MNQLPLLQMMRRFGQFIPNRLNPISFINTWPKSTLFKLRPPCRYFAAVRKIAFTADKYPNIKRNPKFKEVGLSFRFHDVD